MCVVQRQAGGGCAPPQVTATNPQKSRKLIEANINLGKGKNVTLIIYEGIGLEKQINEFALKYRIPFFVFYKNAT